MTSKRQLQMLKFMNNQGLHASTSIIGEFFVNQNYNYITLQYWPWTCKSVPNKLYADQDRKKFYIPNKATIKIATIHR